ncbi:hypothetical protein TNCV_539491 [Trichonephila clavipes]|nr:hypothetical protein TNCV_539491 [Trichonephila clavipes]
MVLFSAVALIGRNTRQVLTEKCYGDRSRHHIGQRNHEFRNQSILVEELSVSHKPMKMKKNLITTQSHTVYSYIHPTDEFCSNSLSTKRRREFSVDGVFVWVSISQRVGLLDVVPLTLIRPSFSVINVPHHAALDDRLQAYGQSPYCRCETGQTFVPSLYALVTLASVAATKCPSRNSC